MFRIVLDAGYFLHIRAFFDNFGTILLYAVVVSITVHANYIFLVSRHLHAQPLFVPIMKNDESFFWSVQVD